MQTVSGVGNSGGYSLNLRQSARKNMVESLTIDNWAEYEVTHPRRENLNLSYDI